MYFYCNMATIWKLVDYSAMSYTVDGSIKKRCNVQLLLQQVNYFFIAMIILLQHADIAKTDQDLEGTGLTRPKRTTRSSTAPDKHPDTSGGEASGPPAEESIDPEQLIDSAQSVKPKQKLSFYEDLHS